MHDHNNNNENKDNGHKGMMWMMIPCLLLFGVLFFGGGKLASLNYLWLVMIGVCMVPHIWMMFKGHGGHNDNNPEDKSEDDKHRHGGSCH